jgi:diguanylate cyclase (GGDEF)-like protein
MPAAGVMGIVLLAYVEHGLPPMLFGALCILWVAWAAWYGGAWWTFAGGTIGLTVLAWRKWPWQASQEIEIACLALLALAVGAWTRRQRQRLHAEHRQARLDSLTGLPNRQAFFERCEAELSRARRFQRPITLILLDGDGFKQVNDRWGHAMGDRALQTVARALQQATRKYDLVARLGGDEFAVLLPETNPTDAENVAQRLQAALASEVAPSFAPLTFSLGVATFFPGHWNGAACLTHADRLLYAAKQSGRGRVCAETLVEKVDS